MTPKVTVLMTVHNGLPYLPQAIESVLRQHVRDFEFLIVDDGSTDGSLDCIQRYGDPRIRLSRNEHNLGQARSLNKGLSLARAPYVARLDQDDVYLPDRLAQQVAWLDQRRDVDVVGTWVYYVNADGRKTGIVGMPVDDYGMFLGALLTYATPFGHPTVMFRREVIAGLGGYDESFAPCEDYALWCRLAQQRRGAVSIPRPLVGLRIHGAQQSRGRSVAQQQQAQRAHHQLVAAFCAPEAARVVSALLRMDEGFWELARSRAQVLAALQMLEECLGTLERTLRLSSQEAAHLRHRVRWWLGHGACLAILHQRYRSLSVYRWVLRHDGWMARYPAMLAYPAGLLCAPLLVPPVRQRCVAAARAVGRLKYLGRLWQSELKTHLAHRRVQPSGAHPPSQEATGSARGGMRGGCFCEALAKQNTVASAGSAPWESRKAPPRRVGVGLHTGES